MQVALPEGVGGRKWGERYDEQRAKRERERGNERRTVGRLQKAEDRDCDCVSLSLITPPNAAPLLSHSLLSFALSACSSCMQTVTTTITITTASSLVRTQLPACSACCSPRLVPHFAALRLVVFFDYF